MDWAGVWFRQTADIALHGEFLPIGWAREYFDSAEQEWQTFAYPFSGSYDGGGYTISGLTIGSESQPSDYLAAGLFGMTAGEYATNEEPSDDLNVVQIRNVAVRDAAVYVSGHQTYVGGLIGIGQDGILVDDCSVTGTVHSYTTDSFSRAGGMAGDLLRGRAADCWTNTNTYAHTTQGSSYSGGLCAMSNRIAMLNCYTLGTTRAYADSNERAYAAGISAFAGELKYNVYAYGAVIAESVSNAVGGVNGLVGGITKEEKVYFNTDAEQSSGGVRKAENSSHGLNYVDMPEDTGYSSEQLQSAAFAAELNENLTALPAFLESVRESLGYPVYYSGDSLRQWALLSGNVVGFAQTEPDAEPAYTVTVNNGTGGGPRKQGENVTITADTPPSGQSFQSWTWTGPDGFTLPNPGSASTTFTMPDGNVTVTATWQSRTTQGCYVATAVYGSYDCPEVWTLRRFRDQVLAKTWYGRLFIHLYYAVSPTAVRLFGGMPWFQSFWRSRLDDMTARLQENGFASTPYEDQTW